MTAYKTLLVWQKAIELVGEIYILCNVYPKEEIFSLTSQTKRAAISIPANIAEGCGRNTAKDTIQFLYISRGSLYELGTHIEIAKVLGYLSEENSVLLNNKIIECLKLLNGLIKRYESL